MRVFIVVLGSFDKILKLFINLINIKIKNNHFEILQKILKYKNFNF